MKRTIQSANIVKNIKEQLKNEFNLDIDTKTIYKCLKMQSEYYDKLYKQDKQFRIVGIGNFLARKKEERLYYKKSLAQTKLNIKKKLSQTNSK